MSKKIITLTKTYTIRDKKALYDFVKSNSEQKIPSFTKISDEKLLTLGVELYRFYTACYKITPITRFKYESGLQITKTPTKQNKHQKPKTDPFYNPVNLAKLNQSISQIQNNQNTTSTYNLDTTGSGLSRKI